MAVVEQTFCTQCGGAFDVSHAECMQAAELSPPRYCGECGRRMQVQVTPLHWRARCSVHGEISG